MRYRVTNSAVKFRELFGLKYFTKLFREIFQTFYDVLSE